MPIRTQRGRSAVYRRVWGWPLTSVTHLAVTGAVVAALVLGIGWAGAALTGGTERQPDPRAGSTPTSSKSEPTPQAPSPSLSSTVPSLSPTPPVSSEPPPSTPAPVPPVPPEALAAASAFTRHFVAHPAGTTTQQWVNQLRPFILPETAGLLGTVDPSRIAATRQTGPPVPTDVGQAVIEVDVPVDTGRLHLVLVQANGWKVRSYTKVGP